jgi:DNA-binding transcriptional ArsR family regulator
MIFIPIFMPQPSVGYASVSKEDRERIQNNRNDVLKALQNTSGLTIQDIAVKTKKEVRQVSAILTVLKRDNQVESEYTEKGKLWRLK